MYTHRTEQQIDLDRAECAWKYQAFHSVTGTIYKLRVDIWRHAYDHESHCRIYVFGDRQWNLLADFPFSQAACQALSYDGGSPDEARRVFEQDESRLLKIAQNILT